MYLRIHDTKDGRIVAACDEGLIGRILDDGKAYLDLDRYRDFYVGEKADPATVAKALTRFMSANLVGKDATDAAITAKVAKKQDIMYINRTPYIQIYRI